MKKILIYLIMVIPLFSKPITKIYDYSDKYIVSIMLDKNDKMAYAHYTISVIDKKTKKKLIESKSMTELSLLKVIKSDFLKNLLDDNLEYEIIHTDFNFDGKKDFAIIGNLDENYNYQRGFSVENPRCPGHVPSYNVYLNRGEKFEHDDFLTTVTRDECSMFKVDYKNKKIYVEDEHGNIRYIE
ncbi:hypothetical protein [Oceanivirga salmonicida]|uniref:hypothetical protein n=1 Tax=Oceanivirga salmonicida TaxID=1769291 RepID=UPI00082E45DA|nr:hypothetical protein [Oceanivirga salmonicida]